MKFFLSGILLFLQVFIVRAQKPVIDSSVYGKWGRVGGDAALSNDGKYAIYSFSEPMLGRNTTVLTATDKHWEKRFTTGWTMLTFTNDSRKVICQRSGDSLTLITLGTGVSKYIGRAASFKLAGQGKQEWLAYKDTGLAGTLTLLNLSTGARRTYAGVIDYEYNGADGDEGMALIMKKRSGDQQSCYWVETGSGESREIWSGKEAQSWVFDKGGSRIALLTSRGGDNKEIWYWKRGQAHASLVAGEGIQGLDRRYTPEGISKFSMDGGLLFFTVTTKANLPESAVEKTSEGGIPGMKGSDGKLAENGAPDGKATDSPTVTVWGYRDVSLPHVNRNGAVDRLLAAVDPETKKYTMITQDHEEIWLNSFMDGGDYSDYGLVGSRRSGIDITESGWNKACDMTEYFLDVRTGTRKRITEIKDYMEKYGFSLSPDKKYIVYYDRNEHNYISYELSTGMTRNITKEIRGEWKNRNTDESGVLSMGNLPQGWLDGGAAVILYDRNDIWAVDPAGKKAPVNITHGYGERNDILLRPAMVVGWDKVSLQSGERLLLCAFDRRTKDNGFFSVVIGSGREPERLTMGPYVYERPGDAPAVEPTAPPIKAKYAEAYLVRRSSEKETPNYFFTTDLKRFIQLTDVQVQRPYNWLSTELHTWRMTDGNYSQGILYKPENFDSTKKYPIIFYYYEKLSGNLHEFMEPDWAFGRMDIPTYVSNGYLVFTPDIHYRVGHISEGAVNAVVSAAEYIGRLPYVDSTKMGLQGHSFGGIQTMMIVTHSHLFAAACPASGIYNMIDMYGNLMDRGKGVSLKGFVETGQMRMGATLWEKPALYIENSPIFLADQVTTPLLMMATTDDGICDFSSDVEFFTSMRRLGKKAWMLEYAGENHSLGKPANSKDFTIRMQAFFDHYLKGKPAPIWMEGADGDEAGGQ